MSELELSLWAGAGYAVSLIVAMMFLIGVAGVVVQLSRLVKGRRNGA